MDLPITEDEIQDALHSMPAGKTPGRDGIPPEFFRWGWDFMKTLLLNAIGEVWEEGNKGEYFNESLIALIPKKEAHRAVDSWRPISLLSTFYKIIVKVLADRIAPFMDSWLFPEQRGFTKGRCILDNLLLVREVKAHLNRNKTPAVLIAFDFSKAYDRVSWPFLWRCMDKYGFGNNFRCWLTILSEEAGVRVIVNGDLMECFDIGRSVQQGCPLAPFLFVILNDFLSWRFRRNKKIKGIRDPEGKEHKISLLADDTFIFSEPSSCSLSAVLREMRIFSFLSGLILNWEKSVILGINLRELLPACVQHMQMLEEDEQTRYLGAPIMLGDKIEAIGQEVLRRIVDKANKLQIMRLSMAGRCLALNAIIENMLWYFMFIWAPSADDVKNLKDLILKFLWDRPIAGAAPPSRVMWTHMVQPQSEGEIGLVDPFIKTQALQSQWIFKALSPAPPLWAGFIRPILSRFELRRLEVCTLATF